MRCDGDDRCSPVLVRESMLVNATSNRPSRDKAVALAVDPHSLEDPICEGTVRRRRESGVMKLVRSYFCSREEEVVIGSDCVDVFKTLTLGRELRFAIEDAGHVPALIPVFDRLGQDHQPPH